MKSELLMVLAAAVLIFSAGCCRRADYLEPKTENSFLKNAGRAAAVLFPLGTAGNVLISEIARDVAPCDGCAATKSCERKNNCKCSK